MICSLVTKFVFELKIFQLLIFCLKSLNVLHEEKYLNGMFQLERSGMSKMERNSILHRSFFVKIAENAKSFPRRGDYYKHEAGLQYLPWVKIFLQTCEQWACSKKRFLMITGESKLLLNLLIFCWSLSQSFSGHFSQENFQLLTKFLTIILSETDTIEQVAIRTFSVKWGNKTSTILSAIGRRRMIRFESII